MLSKGQRISRKNFPRSTKNSLSFHGEFFTLRVYPPMTGKGSLFGCVVSKKVSLQATKRNHLRRQVYSIVKEVFRKQTAKIFIFFPKKEALSTSFELLRKDIVSLIEKANRVA